jgi:hypothetical protein
MYDIYQPRHSEFPHSKDIVYINNAGIAPYLNGQKKKHNG